jgi:signal transduction histidine kinase/streptogramin lyase
MYKDGKFSRYTEEDGLRNNLVASLCEDREKRLWVSANGGGLSMLEKGKVRDVTDEFGLAQYEIRAIYRDRRGVMWLATHRGLLGYRNNLVASYTRKEGLVSDDLRAITEGRDGALWIGSYGGLSRLKDGKIISFTTRDGLGSERVRALYEDSEGVLWIGTYDGGISRLKDGKITAFRASDGLFNNGAFQILEDDRGFLWMTCNKGIYRVSRRQLTDFAEGRSKTITSVAYGKADGLIISECNGGYQPAGIKARDGRLWLPTQGGVAVIDPKEISVNFEPPAVVIESCLIDRKYVDLQNPVRIIPGQQNLEIQYTGLSFIKSEHMRFRYKLEGLDNEWVEAGSRRAAYYSHLPPGNYNFVAIAANSDGVWNETGAGLRIIVIPPLYRTWWFISLTTLSLAAISYFAYKRRIHQLEQAKMMQEKLSRWLIDSQENERKRIAAELHDSLGQGLAIIRNRALSGLHSLDYDLAKEQLSEISAQASQMIEEATEIAYNLRPHFLDRLGLTRSILAMVDRIAKTSGVEWTADLDDLDDLFDKDKEIHLYRIVQEAINNVLKHSGASRAAVAIYRSGNDVIITIEDNGKGMPAGSNAFGQPPQFGFGLIGIAERARIFRAKPSIKSGPGKGTSVTIKLKPEGGAQ